MFGLQPTHWLVILIVALLFFAPSRLPELVRAMRKSVTELRDSLKEPGQPSEPAQSANAERTKSKS